MSASLADSLTAALTEALPGLLGGRRPPLALEVRSEALDFDLGSLEAGAGAPRPEDQVELLAFNPTAPAGPYELTRTPDPGARVVRLVGENGRRSAVNAAEVAWDAGEPRRFVLALRPGRALDGLTGVQVRYAVTAVFTTLRATETLAVALTPRGEDATALAAAELLATAVLVLDRERLGRLDSAHADGDYSALVRVTQLRLLRGAPLPPSGQALTVAADLEIRVSRALREGGGVPIERVDLATEVDA